MTIDTRCLDGTLSPGGFSITRRNSIPQVEVLYDYQQSIHAKATLEPIPDGTPAAVTASPVQLLNQPLTNRGVIPPLERVINLLFVNSIKLIQSPQL